MGLALGACCLASVGSVAASAQMKMDEPMKMGATSPAKALDDLLNLYENDAMGVVKAMPADKYNFAPSVAIFVPGQGVKFGTVRTFVQQVTHVAEANYYFYSAVGGMKPDMDTEALEKITTKDEAVAALAASFAFAHKAIATITPENAFAADQADRRPEHTRDAGRLWRGAWLRSLRAAGGVPADEWDCAAGKQVKQGIEDRV